MDAPPRRLGRGAGPSLLAGRLIIHEPNGGESRLPMTVAASSRGLRLTLGKVTYAVCC